MAVLAHDLKNPMFAVVSILELIKRKFMTYDDAKRFKFIATSHDSAQSTQRVLVKMLEWGSIQQKSFVYYASTNTNITNLI